MRAFATADLWDAHGAELQAVDPDFSDFGGLRRFCGPVTTVKVFEDNSLVRAALEEPGAGRVLVVDGGGSRRCALVGDTLAELARKGGWAGIVVNGCVRDVAMLGAVALGIRALGASPARSEKRGQGVRDVVLRFSGARFEPGCWLYADEDGVVVATRDLLAGQPG
jgi:regulator of ribonuclease activity A